MKAKSQRNTLAKEIKKVAQRGFLSTSLALEIARYGRRLTETENIFLKYYGTKFEFTDAENRDSDDLRHWITFPDGKKRLITWFQTKELRVKILRDGLCDLFMAAVDANDFQKVYELAEAVRFFKINKHPVQQDVDPERGDLLSLKGEFLPGDKDEHKMTIREVAEYLARMKYFRTHDPDTSVFPKLETPADGFSALRRKCRELDFPLAPSKLKSARSKSK